MRSRGSHTVVLAAGVLLAVLVPAGSRPALGATDPLLAQQWHLARIGAPDAWRVTRGAGTTIAVVDTGADLTHPDLDGQIVASASTSGDFVEPKGTCTGKGRQKTCTQDGAQDKNGHGTHVSGIAAAETNGIGGAGTAPGASLLPVRVLDASGSGTSDQVAAGIRYAADKGADVINLSLGFLSGAGTVVKVLGDLTPVYTAIDYAWTKGAVIVIAAGNDSFPLCAEPAANPKAVCVGATDQNEVRTFYSNSDATMTSTFLVAPGGGALTCSGDILSTYLRTADHSSCSPAKGYDVLAGTSMATPFVSGVAALLAGKGLTNAAIVSCLTRTTDDLGVPGRDPIYGYGRVNAFKAVTTC